VYFLCFGLLEFKMKRLKMQEGVCISLLNIVLFLSWPITNFKKIWLYFICLRFEL